jgi:hypothetical protein
VQLPQRPISSSSRSIRYIINAVPAPSLYLNHSRSLLATHPKEVLVDSCHSLVSFLSVFGEISETENRKTLILSSSPSKHHQIHPPFSDELISTICNPNLRK